MDIQESHFPHGSKELSDFFSQFNALANIRAVVVFPIPLTPVSK